MNTEIIVDKKILLKAENDMNKLCDQVYGRKMSVSFSGSKGEMVDEIVELAESLEKFRMALYNLYTATGNAIKKTRVEFEEADNVSANYFHLIGEVKDES